MKIVQLHKQIWEGFYEYELFNEFGAIKLKQIPFELHLSVENDVIKGTRVDDETKAVFDEQITVNGFIEEAEISFIVTYPNNYYTDEETNELTVDKTSGPHQVEYIGYYNVDTNKYTGNWKVIIGEQKDGMYQEDFYELSYNGYWEMSLKL